MSDTSYEPHPDNPEPQDGDTVQVGDLTLTEWRALGYPLVMGSGKCGGQVIYVPLGSPVRVLREVKPDNYPSEPGLYQVTWADGGRSRYKAYEVGIDGRYRHRFGDAWSEWLEPTDAHHCATWKRLPDSPPAESARQRWEAERAANGPPVTLTLTTRVPSKWVALDRETGHCWEWRRGRE